MATLHNRSDHNLNIRLSKEEIERIEIMRRQLQERHGAAVRVTQRTVLLEAIEALSAYLETNSGNRVPSTSRDQQ